MWVVMGEDGPGIPKAACAGSARFHSAVDRSLLFVLPLCWFPLLFLSPADGHVGENAASNLNAAQGHAGDLCAEKKFLSYFSSPFFFFSPPHLPFFPQRRKRVNIRRE